MLVLLIIALYILIHNEVHANSINAIEMDIYIDQNGDAKITETWYCNASKGTEVYHPYYNLGQSKIKDLTVKEGNTQYTTLDYWNTSGTLSSKAYKCGLNYISDGIEICWGISAYGNHTYVVNYTITNFVSELTDSQMVYWTLIPHNMSDKIGRAYIKIHTYYDMPSTTDVWGYGNYGGTCYVYDGIIEMESKGSLNSNEYMTVLAKFPSDTFSTNSKLYNNFEYYLNMANSGANIYQEENSKTGRSILIFVEIFNGILTVIAIPFMLFLCLLVKNKEDLSVNKKIVKNVEYYRDIPCDKDIYRAYYIATKYGLTIRKSDLLGAVILKWLKNRKCKNRKKTGRIYKEKRRNLYSIN